MYVHDKFQGFKSRMACVVKILYLKVGKIAEQDQDKNYGPVGLTTGGSNKSISVYQINSYRTHHHFNAWEGGSKSEMYPFGSHDNILHVF